MMLHSQHELLQLRSSSGTDGEKKAAAQDDGGAEVFVGGVDFVMVEENAGFVCFPDAPETSRVRHDWVWYMVIFVSSKLLSAAGLVCGKNRTGLAPNWLSSYLLELYEKTG